MINVKGEKLHPQLFPVVDKAEFSNVGFVAFQADADNLNGV